MIGLVAADRRARESPRALPSGHPEGDCPHDATSLLQVDMAPYQARQYANTQFAEDSEGSYETEAHGDARQRKPELPAVRAQRVAR